MLIIYLNEKIAVRADQIESVRRVKGNDGWEKIWVGMMGERVFELAPQPAHQAVTKLSQLGMAMALSGEPLVVWLEDGTAVHAETGKITSLAELRPKEA